MMHTHIQKVLNVWETTNKVTDPVRKKLYLDIIEQIANLFAAGSYYYYILNFENLEMELVHQDTRQVLGIEPENFTLESLLNCIHSEDLEKLHEKEARVTDFLLNRIPVEQLPHYKVVYLLRLRHKDGTWKTILHQAITLVVSNDGKIQKVLGIHTDVTYLNMKVDHRVSFVSSKFPSYYSSGDDAEIEPLVSRCSEIFTIRELEIIKKIAEGKNLQAIAKELYISPETAKTHKRNILRKTECRNFVELVARCIREGVI